MTYLEYKIRAVPKGFRKVFYLNWPIILLLCAAGAIGIIMFTSVAGNNWQPWASAQLKRFFVGFSLMIGIAMIPIWFWKSMSLLAYIASFVLLVLVDFFGSTGMGAQRWFHLGFIILQPSEMAKITLIMVLAFYYDWLQDERVSKPQWLVAPLVLIFLPFFLVLQQPDLGTSLLIVIGGGVMMFLAGVHWGYFGAGLSFGVGGVLAILNSRGKDWQLLNDYQYRRIDTFLDPSSDPLGAGYHITQSKIALGSGGWTGRGFGQGTQSRLNFLPEKHTDFIFTTLAEEFGFVGGISLLTVYTLIVAFAIIAALRNRDRFSSLLIYGVTVTFFLYFAVNMAMVMGLAPVVGVPLPLVSYGGSSLLVLMVAFGLLQSAHVHKPRGVI